MTGLQAPRSMRNPFPAPPPSCSRMCRWCRFRRGY